MHQPCKHPAGLGAMLLNTADSFELCFSTAAESLLSVPSSCGKQTWLPADQPSMTPSSFEHQLSNACVASPRYMDCLTCTRLTLKSSYALDPDVSVELQWAAQA